MVLKGDEVVTVVRALREVGAQDAVATLAARALGQPRADYLSYVNFVALVEALAEAGAQDALTTLANRAVADRRWGAGIILDALGIEAKDAIINLAADVAVEDPGIVADILYALGNVGAQDEITALATRAAGHAAVDDCRAVASLLTALHNVGARDATTTLAARSAEYTKVGHFADVTYLLNAMREAEIKEPIAILATRAANAGLFEVLLQIDEDKRFIFGREPNGVISAPWKWEQLVEHMR